MPLLAQPRQERSRSCHSDDRGAVEQIYVTHKTGVEERRLICGCLASADQRAPARSPVFLELFAQCLEGLPLQRSDGAAEAVQNIALENSPGVVRHVLRPGGCGARDE